MLKIRHLIYNVQTKHFKRYRFDSVIPKNKEWVVAELLRIRAHRRHTSKEMTQSNAVGEAVPANSSPTSAMVSVAAWA